MSSSQESRRGPVRFSDSPIIYLKKKKILKPHGTKLILIIAWLLSVTNSPSLGTKTDIVAQVIIEANDDAFGVLQLSASAVSVAEHYVGPIINVTRVGGIFADVSVKFRAVPLTARVSKCNLQRSMFLQIRCETRQVLSLCACVMLQVRTIV